MHFYDSKSPSIVYLQFLSITLRKTISYYTVETSQSIK